MNIDKKDSKKEYFYAPEKSSLSVTEAFLNEETNFEYTEDFLGSMLCEVGFQNDQKLEKSDQEFTK